MAQLSHDHKLIEQLKQRFVGYLSHDWKKQYDEQGGLLRLNLRDLEILQLSPELWQFTSLQELDLNINQLSSLPTKLDQLTNLQSLDLYENPQLLIPPPEIVEQGIPVVLAYLRILLQAVERVKVKRLLVGKGDISLPSSTKAISSDENDGNQYNLNRNGPTDETSREKSGANRKGTLPIKIFYCYAHEDKDLRNRIDKHLVILKRLGQIIGWYDREIQAGKE